MEFFIYFLLFLLSTVYYIKVSTVIINKYMWIFWSKEYVEGFSDTQTRSQSETPPRNNFHLWVEWPIRPPWVSRLPFLLCVSSVLSVHIFYFHSPNAYNLSFTADYLERISLYLYLAASSIMYRRSSEVGIRGNHTNMSSKLLLFHIKENASLRIAEPQGTFLFQFIRTRTWKYFLVKLKPSLQSCTVVQPPLLYWNCLLWFHSTLIASHTLHSINEAQHYM